MQVIQSKLRLRLDTHKNFLMKHEPHPASSLPARPLCAPACGHRRPLLARKSAGLPGASKNVCYYKCLGHAAQLRGDAAGAVRNYRRAAALDKNDAELWHTLATLLAQQDALAEAERCYRHVLELRPDAPGAHHNLGNVLLRQGKHGAAAECYARAVALRPEPPEFHYKLGYALHESGALAQSAEAFRNLIAAQPDNFVGHFGLASVSQELGELEAAAEAYRRALEIKPDFAAACTNLGVVYDKLGDPAAAVDMQRRALRIDPRLLTAQNNLGTALSSLGESAAAVDAFRRVLDLQPDHVAGLCNLGFELLNQGNDAAGLECYRRALAVAPESAPARFHMATANLERGNFSEGWEGYEARWDMNTACGPKRDFPQPRWRGEALSGARILLYAEQGLGDTMQFVRYLPLVAARGGQVVLEVPPQVYRLLSHFPGATEVVVRGQPLPSFDCHCPLMSLPLVFATGLTNIPADIPYLQADAEAAHAWSSRLLPETFRVGLAWGGSPKHSRERQRSIPLAQLAPLTMVPGATFYSLQKGVAAEQLRDLPAEFKIIDLDSAQRDFADTAAIVANLDLVISVDTSVAHLAGAMGKPVWILLHHMPDWRWLRNREDSPWYPTARLFRQAQARRWDTVVERLRSELQRLAADRDLAQSPNGRNQETLTAD